MPKSRSPSVRPQIRCPDFFWKRSLSSWLGEGRDRSLIGTTANLGPLFAEACRKFRIPPELANGRAKSFPRFGRKCGHLAFGKSNGNLVPLAMMEFRRGELRPYVRRSLSKFIFRNEYSINLLVTMWVQVGFRRSSIHPALLLLPAVSPQSTIGCLKAS